MKVAYFSNQFACRVRHGVARYAEELFRALDATNGELCLRPVAAWSDLPAAEFARLHRETGLRLLPWGQKITPLAWTFLGCPRLENWMAEPVSLVHAVALGYPIATRLPYVVTIHDIGPLTHPEYFTRKASWIFRRSLRQAVMQAAALICVSQATADELEDYARRHYGTDLRERITVVHEGVGEEFFETPPEAANPPVIGMLAEDVPILLTAGKISPRKNVHGVIRALGELKDRIPHHLVAVGGDGWNFEEVKREAVRAGVADRVHFAGFVSDAQLRALYRRAAVYVHASFFEGFGLTVLEAMASGCPVVTSNCSSLPEVAGEAGLLVDPHDSSAIADAIAALCEDPDVAASFRRKGRIQAKAFRWDRCAAQVADVYREVVAG